MSREMIKPGSWRWYLGAVIVLLFVLGILFGARFLVNSDGDNLELVPLYQEGDPSVLSDLSLVGVLADTGAATPFAQGFTMTGPEMQVTDVWHRLIDPLKRYPKTVADPHDAAYQKELYMYDAGAHDRDGIVITRSNPRKNQRDSAYLAMKDNSYRVRRSFPEREFVLETETATFLLLPQDAGRDSWIYRIDAWQPDGVDPESETAVIQPLATVSRALRNTLIGFYRDDDTLLVVTTEDPVYALYPEKPDPGMGNTLQIHRYTMDGTELGTIQFQLEDRSIGGVACADHHLFFNVSRKDEAGGDQVNRLELMVLDLDAPDASWTEINLDVKYLPGYAFESYAQRAYAVADGCIAVADRVTLEPELQESENVWVYPDGVEWKNTGEQPPHRQAIQLQVYKPTGEMVFRGIFDPGLSQDHMLPGGETYRQLVLLDLIPNESELK